MGNHVRFDATGYTAALKRAVSRALDETRESIYRSLLVNLAGLKVRKVDAKHASSFPRALKATIKVTGERFVARFGMSNEGANQSFRALYYEYGTGTKMSPPSTFDPSIDHTWNANREGIKSPIYFRKGSWVDLGGNIHKSKFKGGGKVRIDPRKNLYGEEISAQHWFREGLKSGTKNLDMAVLQAVKSVPVTAYIKLRDIRVRM